jgi:hypothetical protein
MPSASASGSVTRRRTSNSARSDPS